MSPNGAAASWDDDRLDDQLVVMVTGANAGLGLSICCRLIDDFLTTFPTIFRLHLIFTTRSIKKCNETRSHLHRRLLQSQDRNGGNATERVKLHAEVVDLTRLRDVRQLARRLDEDIPKLDAIILNAGIGGWTGLNWPKCIWKILTDPIVAVSWPSYKIGPVGVLTDKQTSQPDEPPLGSVFCANVFGHYLLAHYLMPLLKRSGQPNGPGRIIWVSSLEATTNRFNVDDIQGLRTTEFYETSKTLTDILVLTSTLPSTARWRATFMSEPPSALESSHQDFPPSSLPNHYLSHPGVCGTGIVALPLILFYCMVSAFYLARWYGSPWHTITTYLGACAPTWLALSPQAVLDEAERVYKEHGGGGRAKWGSSTDRCGRAKPASSEVEGWGFGGVVGPAVRPTDAALPRKRGATDPTADDRTRFEELGQRCWQEMEELRMQWVELLDRDAKATEE